MCFIDQSEARLRTLLILPFGITAPPDPWALLCQQVPVSKDTLAAALQVPTLLCSSRTKMSSPQLCSK